MTRNWNEALDRIKDRVKILQTKTDDTNDIIPEIGKDLEAIERGLIASKEVVEKEADQHPVIEKSVQELEDEVTKLETKVNTLQTNQKDLKTRTAGIATISISIGAIGGIAIWTGLKNFKGWLDTHRTPRTTTT